MSGHSKWHNIQDRKGKQDAKRSNLFTKYAKGITIAAQKGGDQAANFSLRLAIEKAKEVGMPKDNIDRAIKRGTGELSDGMVMEEALYEAFGPGGIAILVKVITDNKNRTLSDLKHMLNEAGGSIAGAGSVQWMFGQWGVITLAKDALTKSGVDPQELELKLIDAGVEDMRDGEENEVEIKTKVENFKKVLDALKMLQVETSDSSILWVPKDTVPITKAVEEQLTTLFGEFEVNDDVENYFTNAE